MVESLEKGYEHANDPDFKELPEMDRWVITEVTKLLKALSGKGNEYWEKYYG